MLQQRDRWWIMRAELLRERWTLEAETLTDGPAGSKVRTWPPIATVPAHVRPLSTDERIQAEQAKADISHEVTIRYRAVDRGTPLRLTQGGRILAVEGAPVDPDGRRRWLRLRCRELVP